MKIYTLHFDGSCGPTNPGGTAAYGYALSFEDNVIPGNAIIGTGPNMSNNLAEFVALARGLECAQRYASKGDLVNVRGDSQLVINIMSGHWKPSDKKLYWLGYLEARDALRQLRLSRVAVSFDWVPREQNTLCDGLSKDYVKLTQRK